MGKCKQCSKDFDDANWPKQFCNRSCAAKFNNKGICRNGSPRKIIACEICKKPTFNPRFCCKTCMGASSRNITLKRFFNGEITDEKTIRNVLIRERGHQCEECGLKEWLGQQIPLDVHHKDGNFRNNENGNLVLNCKNCHALTDTFGSKNIGYGRPKRRIKGS